MGDYAASGGYYISCIADTIVAEPTTLTGSIGIFGMVPNVKELTDKVGLTYDVVKQINLQISATSCARSTMMKSINADDDYARIRYICYPLCRRASHD